MSNFQLMYEMLWKKMQEEQRERLAAQRDEIDKILQTDGDIKLDTDTTDFGFHKLCCNIWHKVNKSIDAIENDTYLYHQFNDTKIIDLDRESKKVGLDPDSVQKALNETDLLQRFTDKLRSRIKISPELIAVEWINKDYGCAGDCWYIIIDLTKWRDHVKQNYQLTLEPSTKKRKATPGRETSNV